MLHYGSHRDIIMEKIDWKYSWIMILADLYILVVAVCVCVFLFSNRGNGLIVLQVYHPSQKEWLMH